MPPPGNPAERGAGLALPAGRDDQDIALGQPHRFVEPHDLGEIEQIARGLGDLQNPVEASPRHAHGAPGFGGNPPDRGEPRRIRREGRHQHAALGLADFGGEPGGDAFFAARRGLLKDIGRIAHQREDALVADLGQRLSRGGMTKHRRFIDLPVAGVENLAVGRLDQHAIALGNRVGERDVGDTERREIDRSAALDDVELDLARQPLFLKLAGDQPRGKRGRIKRHAKVGRHVRQRADMIFVAVRQDDPDKVLAALLDELQLGQDQVDARRVAVGEGQPQVEHQPFAVAPIEVDVHPDLARPPQREEEKFFTGGGHGRAFWASRARPWMVRSGSIRSNASVCWSNNVARPPVASTVTGRPISALSRATSPSIIAI